MLQLEVMHAITHTHNECYNGREFTRPTTSTTWMHLYYTVFATLSSLHCLAKETTSESTTPTTWKHLRNAGCEPQEQWDTGGRMTVGHGQQDAQQHAH